MFVNYRLNVLYKKINSVRNKCCTFYIGYWRRSLPMIR